MATRTTLPSLLLMLVMVSCSSSATKSVSKMGQPDLASPSLAPDLSMTSTTLQDMTSLPVDLSLLQPVNIRTPPATGAYLGAFVGTGAGGTDAFQSEEQLIARPWVIDNTFYSTENWGTLRAPWDIANHKIPHITWQPADALDDIISGAADALYHTRAAEAKAFGADFFLRWGHEMNGNWYPWAGVNNGGAGVGPPKYVAAWKHVHDLFVADGVTNVQWVWCPIVTDVPSDAWNHWANYYPGDAYVDWVGIDTYNWGTSSSCCVWESFTDLTQALYADYAGKKPIIISEMSSAEVGGNKAAWIEDFHTQMKTNFTGIKAVVWFDINKETDWRIDSSAPTLAAYKSLALDPYFNP